MKRGGRSVDTNGARVLARAAVPPKRRGRPKRELSAIALRFKQLRAERGWTQEDLARAAGDKKAYYVANIESGDTKRPGADKIAQYAKAFGVSVETLMGEDRPGHERTGLIRAIRDHPRLNEQQKNELIARLAEFLEGE